jgi:membrane protein involved in colicin uptake
MAVEEVVAKKAAEEAAGKKAAEEATAKKAAEEAAVKKKAADEAATKKASEEAAKKTESGVATAGSGSVGMSQEGGCAQWLYTSGQATIPRLLEASVRYATLLLPFLVPCLRF